MPKREDIRKILIIGSGPIVIGQACEFDYSGTQACKALKKLGYEIVLVNSNPATIMTDPQTADITYIEPLSVEKLSEIIRLEKPDALLPNLGGQTALNLSSELDRAGVLAEHGVEVIGVRLDAIERGEDRISFKETMRSLGIEMPRSMPAYSLEEAEGIAEQMGFPVVIRPAYTMGGAGGGTAYNAEELRTIAARGIAASMVGQVLIEESVIGWEELEVEVVRDSKNQTIAVCFIENIDPMGVHTGDSFCAAPFLNVSEDVRFRLQEAAFKIVKAIEVIGGCNCQFAYNRQQDKIVVIEINPRTSRSSALASKATGFPIAMVSALLAAGLTLDELPYWRGGTLEQYTPADGYVVVKFARWAFEKFKDAQDSLGTQMKAVGEVMSIGRTYKEALQKAIRSLEIGRSGLGFARDFHQRTLPELLQMLRSPNSERQFILYEALRKGASVEELSALTFIKPYFLEQMKELVALEEELLSHRGGALPDELLLRAKRDGFADKYIAEKLLFIPEDEVRRRRLAAGLPESWEFIRVSGVENALYHYSTYNPSGGAGATRAPALPQRKVMILGGGPNRIGQGIEFDYCCVHAAFALRETGFSTVMVNCNPETVSTDYDTADTLYFEPLTVEDVLSICEQEKPLGVIVQFGGQTPLNLAGELARLGVPILGTPPDIIDLAEDRDRFRLMMEQLDIPMPESGMASNLPEALAVAERIGYPLMVRPSYVLGGRGMEVVHDGEDLARYVAAAVDISPDRPILIDRFLGSAIECEADAISDGTHVFVPAVMEHIELAGIHSGDSACVIPPRSIAQAHLDTIDAYTERIARALGVVGLMNMQYAIADGRVYVLEANPRASRTVPLVSKVCNLPMAHLATQCMLAAFTGRPVNVSSLRRARLSHFGVKEAVFPFSMFPEVDPLLGPEMRSTGEVLGLSSSFGLAYYKSQEAAGAPLPLSGAVLLSIADTDKAELLEVASLFAEMGFTLVATSGTHRCLSESGLSCRHVHKLGEGQPDVSDLVKAGDIALIINTPGTKKSHEAGAYIRRVAIRSRVPYITTMAAARAACTGISEQRTLSGERSVKSLQAYHRDMRADG